MMTHIECKWSRRVNAETWTWRIEGARGMVMMLRNGCVKVLGCHCRGWFLLNQERRDGMSEHGQVDGSRDRAASLTFMTTRWMKAIAGI